MHVAIISYSCFLWINESDDVTDFQQFTQHILNKFSIYPNIEKKKLRRAATNKLSHKILWQNDQMRFFGTLFTKRDFVLLARFREGAFYPSLTMYDGNFLLLCKQCKINEQGIWVQRFCQGGILFYTHYPCTFTVFWSLPRLQMQWDLPRGILI